MVRLCMLSRVNKREVFTLDAIYSFLPQTDNLEKKYMYIIRTLLASISSKAFFFPLPLASWMLEADDVPIRINIKFPKGPLLGFDFLSTPGRLLVLS